MNQTSAQNGWHEHTASIYTKEIEGTDWIALCMADGDVAENGEIQWRIRLRIKGTDNMVRMRGRADSIPHAMVTAEYLANAMAMHVAEADQRLRGWRG